MGKGKFTRQSQGEEKEKRLRLILETLNCFFLAGVLEARCLESLIELDEMNKLASRFFGNFPWLVRKQPWPFLPEFVLDDIQVLNRDTCLRSPLSVLFLLGLR